ncbi:MAG TPA: precorrin-6Y C5,15-methyltransferase (decarboxylating) subunit CbiT [Nitrososphaeraceae archaeon]|nr:precorrin-6Y C5,15-methyltransferase (decarboxylating) subunit CbiT [Nitrososphaeraceae archaeon]
MLWRYDTPGIPDELFERSEQVPITKEEVRAITISKLRLNEGFAAIDVGCGSGSLTVEICNQIKGGAVYAIDFDEKAVELTRMNLSRFGFKAEVILSDAENALPRLPQVNSIVIGGTWGNSRKIIEMGISKLQTNGRLVVNTILIESAYEALSTIYSANLEEVDVTQVLISKSRKVTTGTMMLARNPVLIISATKPTF